MIKIKNNKLLSNTLFLYGLTFSNYFFGFITIPYQTRILGPEYYGKIGFAVAFMAYFQLVIDFGFMLYATAEVSKNREDKHELSKIMTAVVTSKLIIIFFSFIMLLVLIISVDKFRSDIWLYSLFFILAALNSLLPDYLYRGLENMKIITYRTVSMKLFFTLMIFVLLKEQTQYYLIPIINIAGAIFALTLVYFHIFKKMKLHFVSVSVHYVQTMIKNSSIYFYSRIASSVYNATNIFILGFLYPTGNIVGYYTSSNTLVNTARNGFSPIADSLYPYMIKNKNFGLIKKILSICMPLVIFGCIVIGIFAESVCLFLFGEEFREAAHLLRLLLPLIVLALPNYILGFPTLTPLGLQKYANISTIFGAILQIIGLILLYIIDQLNVNAICILTCFTELFVLLFRIWAIINRKKLTAKRM